MKRVYLFIHILLSILLTVCLLFAGCNGGGIEQIAVEPADTVIDAAEFTQSEQVPAKITDRQQFIQSGYSIDFAVNPGRNLSHPPESRTLISVNIYKNGSAIVNTLIADLHGFAEDATSYDDERLNEFESAISGCFVSCLTGGGAEFIAIYDKRNHAIIVLRKEIERVDTGFDYLDIFFTEGMYSRFVEILRVDLDYYDTHSEEEPYIVLSNTAKTVTPVLVHTGDEFFGLTVDDIDVTYDEIENTLQKFHMKFNGEIRLKGALRYQKYYDGLDPYNGVMLIVNDEYLSRLPYPV